MEEYNYIGIFDPDDTEIMVNKVNEYLISIDEFMPLVEQCKLSRIDFCANIEMSGQHEIFEYIKILQKGYCPKNSYQNYSMTILLKEANSLKIVAAL